MKKLIGIVSVAIIAMVMFFSTSSVNSTNEDFNLTNLLNMNTANAECGTTSQQTGEDCEYFCNTMLFRECDILIICSDGNSATLTCPNKNYSF